MQVTPRWKIFSVVVALGLGLTGCESLTGKKSVAAAPTDAAIPDDTSTSATDDSGSTSTPTDTATSVPGLDKSCTAKETCTPAAMSLLLNPSGNQLTGTAGQTATWVLTAVDTNTLGGVATALPVAGPAPSPDTSSDSGSGSGGSSLDLLDATAGSSPAAVAGPAVGMITPNLAGASSRHVAMILSGLPAEATVVPVTLGKPVVTATITWIPTIAGTGAITVILRDYDRCFVSEPDQTVCERSTILPAYDVQHAAIPIVIGSGKPACPAAAANSGFLGLPNLFGSSAGSVPAGC